MVRITQQKHLKKIKQEIDNKGLIHVLRKGFNDVHGGNIKTLYFNLRVHLNPKYRKINILKISFF